MEDAGGGQGRGGCPTLRRGTGGVQQRAQGAEAVLGELERPAHVELEDVHAHLVQAAVLR